MEDIKRDYDKVRDIILSCNNTNQLKVAVKVCNKLIGKHNKNLSDKQINTLKQLVGLMRIKCTKGKEDNVNEISEIGKEFRNSLNATGQQELRRVASTIEEEINIGTQIEQNHLSYNDALTLATQNVDNTPDYYTNPNYCVIAVESKNGHKKTIRVEKDLYEKSKTEKNVLIMDDMEISHKTEEDDIDESTTTISSGAFVAPFNSNPIARTIKKGHIPVSKNGITKSTGKITVLEEDEDLEEAVDYTGAVGQYTTPKIWAKNKSQWRGANKPTHKGGKFVNMKKKCKTYPYCNQGAGSVYISNTSDMEIDNVFSENKIIKKSKLRLNEQKGDYKKVRDKEQKIRKLHPSGEHSYKDVRYGYDKLDRKVVQCRKDSKWDKNTGLGDYQIIYYCDSKEKTKYVNFSTQPSHEQKELDNQWLRKICEKIKTKS